MGGIKHSAPYLRQYSTVFVATFVRTRGTAAYLALFRVLIGEEQAVGHEENEKAVG